MHDAACMSKPDGIGDLHQNFKILLKRLLSNHFQPRSPLDFLHRVEERPFRIGTDIINRDDIRVVQIARHHRFGEELCTLLLVARGFGFQHLDRYIAINRCLSGIEDDPHSPFAKDFQKFVFRFVPGRGCGTVT